MISNLKGFVFYVWTFASVLTFGPFIVLYSILIKNPKFVFEAVVWFVDVAFFFCRIKAEVHGRENMDESKPYLVLSNHQSFLDIPLIMKNVRILSFLAKIEIKKWPMFGYGMTQMNCIFVDRADPNSRSSIAEQMLAKMRNNVSFCVFPEGTRSKNRTPLPFKRGIFKIAKTSGLEILPVTIYNSCDILPKKTFRLSSGTIKLQIHPPVSSLQFATTGELHREIEAIITKPLLKFSPAD